MQMPGSCGLLCQLFLSSGLQATYVGASTAVEESFGRITHPRRMRSHQEASMRHSLRQRVHYFGENPYPGDHKLQSKKE